MQPELIEVMHDQVRTIYRALTGAEIPEPTGGTSAGDAAFEEVWRRFIELETMARADPSVAARVPPFSFTPALDATYREDGLVVEVALPGVDERELEVEVIGRMLVISGVRRGDSNGWSFCHAEIPRGSFYRAFPVPFDPLAQPSVEMDRGLLRVHLTPGRAAQTAP